MISEITMRVATVTAMLEAKNGDINFRNNLFSLTDGDHSFTDPVADTKVVLLDPVSGKPVAKGRTGADGTFKIDNVPAGEYDVVVVGPWQPVDPGFMFLTVHSNPQAQPQPRRRPGWPRPGRAWSA